MLRSAYFTGHAFEALESPFLSETIVSRRAEVETEWHEQEHERELEQESIDAFEAGEAEAAQFEEALDFIERPENEIRTGLEGESAFEAVTDGFAPPDTASEDLSDEAGEWAADDEHAAIAEAFAAVETEADLEHTVDFEEEVLGGSDERKPVADVPAVPTRWICALDIWEANPDWGQKTNASKEIVTARGTGILIGPRHVLTARHVVEQFIASRAGKIKRITVSPARDGDNGDHPFGDREVAAVHQSRPFQPPGTRPGSSGSLVREDFALLVLAADAAEATHATKKTRLGYWGEDQRVATIAALPDRTLHRSDARVTGYPGDRCGTRVLKSASTDIQKLIGNCERTSPGEWASKQFSASGVLDARNVRLLYHTADTFEGQSGSPIFLAIGKVCHLAGVHTDKDNGQRNQGVRVTARMLNEIAAWINLDTSIATAAVQNGTLTVRRAAPAKASEMEEGDGREI